MTRKWVIAAACGAYLAALILSLPATLFDSAVKNATEGRIRLVETRGTLWSGNAQLEFREAADLAGIAQGVTWRCMPWYLFVGRLAFDVRLEQSQRSFSLAVSPSQIKISDGEVHLPAAALGLAAPKLKPFGLGGNILLKVHNLSIRANSVVGAATVEWRGATSTLTPVSPLGDYALHFNSENAGPHWILNTMNGPLHIDGQETATATGMTAFVANLSVEEQFREQLTPLLRLIAVERAPGSYELRVE